MGWAWRRFRLSCCVVEGARRLLNKGQTWLLTDTGEAAQFSKSIVRRVRWCWRAAPVLASSTGAHVDYNQQVKEFQGYGKGLGVYHSPVNTQAHFSNLLLTIAQKMGVEAETFANSNGVISEILS